MLKRTRPLAVLIAGETALVFAAVAVGAYLRLGGAAWRVLSLPAGILRISLIVFVSQVCLHYADLYDLSSVNGVRDLLLRLFQALGATSLILAALYFWFPELIVGRGVFLLSVIVMIGLIISWRLAFRWLSDHVAPRERLLLVGTSPATIRLARELFDRREELGVDIAGFADPDPARVGTAVINPGVVGTIEDIPSLVTRLAVDRVVVGLSETRGMLPTGRLLDVRMRSGVNFDHLASVYEKYTGKIAVENLRPSWFIFSDGFRKTRSLMAAKRAIDVVAALAGLIVALPLLLVIAVVVKVSSRGSVFYHQERVGLNGRNFTVHKFRTMGQDAEASTGPVWSRPSDARVTPVGRFLRRLRLDEIPQLWNVLRGEMSLVGPRPERPSFVSQLSATIPFYGQRHVIKPGLTGWAQIRYTYGASIEDAIEKLQYDLYYIKNLSIALDIVIVIETIKTVLLRRGSR
jgi:sugar transferase (PEP-CTERM system associated)